MANNGTGLTELNQELFAQLRRLSTAQGDELKTELERTNAVCNIAGRVVDNATLALKVSCVAQQVSVPEMLKLENLGA